MVASPKSIGQALVSSKLDYANGILCSVSQLAINNLQKVQKARVVLRAHYGTDAALLLAKLHWLSIVRRILLRLATLTFISLD